MRMSASKRPKHLDLLQIKLPIPGVVSILHRISGAGMIIMLPVVLYVLDQSLKGHESFDFVVGLLNHLLVKLVMVGLGWAFIHHVLAGIRFLLLDLHLGVELEAARKSAWLVSGLAGLLTLLFALRIFLL